MFMFLFDSVLYWTAQWVVKRWSHSGKPIYVLIYTRIKGQVGTAKHV